MRGAWVFGVAVIADLGCSEPNPLYVSAGDTSGQVAGEMSSSTGSAGEVRASESGSTTTTTRGPGGTTSAYVDWWDLRWAHRRQLRVDNSGQDEAFDDFAVLVSLSVADFDYGTTQDEGADLRFVGEDGVTVFAHEIENWDREGTSHVWVKLPRIEASVSRSYGWLYYGGVSAPAVENDAFEGYAAVFHLNEDSGVHRDSVTGIACSWFGAGAGSQDAVGRIAGANEFDGAEDAANCGADPIPDAEYNTITAWVRLPLTGDEDQEVVAYEGLTSPFSGLGLYVRTPDGALGKWLSGEFRYAQQTRVAPDAWSFIVSRTRRHGSAGLVEVSVNAGPWETVVEGNTSNLRVRSGTPLVIGKWSGPGVDASTRGIIDEVRISTLARGDAWIRAQYLSQSGTFAALGAEESR